MDAAVDLTVRKRIDVDMDVRLYEVSCSQCGTDLDFEARTDRDGDIFVGVQPCVQCTKEAADGAVAEARRADAEAPHEGDRA